jgi:hypothetical protein
VAVHLVGLRDEVIRELVVAHPRHLSEQIAEHQG